MSTSTRRRPKWLRCIPPAEVLRERLAATETELAQQRELLATAERIEAAEQSTAPAAPPQEAPHG